MTQLKEILKYIAPVLIAIWQGLNPMVQFLTILMFLDFITGLLNGFILGQANSDASFKGLAKKLLVLCLIMALAIGKTAAGLDFEIAGTVAAMYIIHELLSILENVARSGIPLPSWLIAALKNANKLQDVADVTTITKTKSKSEITTIVHENKETPVE